MAGLIHPTAVVDPSAELGVGVAIGPFAVVGPGVVLGDRTILHAHAVVLGPSVLGGDNVVHAFAVVGGDPQLKDQERARGSRLTLGDGNVIREQVTIHRGADVTRVGDDNLFMVGSHVAHDAVVGSRVTLANGAQLAGHAIVEDDATFGGLSGVAQFVRVGEGAFVAAGAMCERAVPRFVIVQGDRAKVRALNIVGLRRRGVPEASIARLEAAFRAVFSRDLPLSRAIEHADAAERAHEDGEDPFVRRFLEALRQGGKRP